MAALPYDVMNRTEAKEWAAGNAYSFLHISRAEIDMPDEVNPYDKSVYEKSSSNFQSWIKMGFIKQDRHPCLYFYRIEMGEVDQTGIVCLSSIADYENGIIKKHEYTRPEKEQDRIDQMYVSGLHTEPIFLAYKEMTAIRSLVENYKTHHAPEYNFLAEDGISHQLWVVDNIQIIQEIIGHFQQMPCTYIADGHHRAASTYRVGLKEKEANKNHNGTEAYNHILTVLFPDDQVRIYDYNRLVKDLNGLCTAEFLDAVQQHFEIVEKGEHIFKPREARHFGLYVSGSGYLIKLKQEVPISSDPVFSLDTSILQQFLLEPVLDIKDQRTDKRIDFVGGIRGMNELEKRVNSGEMSVAFAIYPVTINQLFTVADSGRVMPPKSTWFEPKLRSGLFVHQFREWHKEYV